MWRYVFIGSVLIAFATQAPGYLQKQINQSDTSSDSASQTVRNASVESAASVESGASVEERRSPSGGRKAYVRRDRSGHYLAKARMNGRSLDVLVDTGATMVAINETTAKRLGINLRPHDFRYQVRTANGVTLAAKATIDRIEIGDVEVRRVKATIARDQSLSTVLLGMSFLNKLKKFEVDGSTLVLTQ